MLPSSPMLRTVQFPVTYQIYLTINKRPLNMLNEKTSVSVHAHMLSWRSKCPVFVSCRNWRDEGHHFLAGDPAVERLTSEGSQPAQWPVSVLKKARIQFLRHSVLPPCHRPFSSMAIASSPWHPPQIRAVCGPGFCLGCRSIGLSRLLYGKQFARISHMAFRVTRHFRYDKQAGDRVSPGSPWVNPLYGPLLLEVADR